MSNVDPNSPVPLYHQIAEAIRKEIEAGTLAEGEALDPLRRAAERWNVNLHTVRHAYAALARSGLVESNRGPKGTRVAIREVPQPQEASKSLEAFLTEVTNKAQRRFDLTPEQLARELHRQIERTAHPETIYFVECSKWQCLAHGRELTDRFEVDCRPWVLDSSNEPPPGTVLSTYFHYNDIRRAWPRRLSEIHFVTIAPDPELRHHLAGYKQVAVVDRDESTLEALLADVRPLVSDDVVIEARAVQRGAELALPDQEGTPMLVAPRVWADLPEGTQLETTVQELRYLLDNNELTQLGSRLGWRPNLGESPKEMTL